MDTSEAESNLRISQREGHFYGGKPTDTPEVTDDEATSQDDNEWNFAPVDFPHRILDGSQPIDTNAAILSSLILELSKNE